jgi:hypothetical protein
MMEVTKSSSTEHLRPDFVRAYKRNSAINADTYPQQEVSVLPIGKVIVTQVGSRQEHVVVRDTRLDVRDRLRHNHTMGD